jgi:hypothetical protein
VAFGNNKQRFDCQKLILLGKVNVNGDVKYCLMVFNLNKAEIEHLKILSFIENQTINCMTYGPFDNGHILLGLSDGWLLAYSYPALERVACKQIFWENRSSPLFDSSLIETGFSMQVGNTVMDSADSSDV